MLRLETARLTLIAATIESASAEIRSSEELASVLGCAAPADWPPPLNDEESARYFLDLMREHPADAGWAGWYFLDRGNGALQLVGNGGFKGAPADGTVEVGYSIVPAFQRRGYATEAMRELISWAFRDDRVERVIAHTLPELTPSIGVLTRLGFTFDGEGEEAGTIRYMLPKGAKAPGETTA